MQSIYDAFRNGKPFSEVGDPRQGLATTNNAKFIRRWSEVSISKTIFTADSKEEAIKSRKKWFPLDKGGEFRKWYGNNEFVLNFENNGLELCAYIDSSSTSKVGSNGRVINRDKYFHPGITWTAISSGSFSARYTKKGHLFSNAGMKSFPINPSDICSHLGLLNSSVVSELIICLSQTLNFDQGVIARLPVILIRSVDQVVKCLMSISEDDWNSYETSWEFNENPVIRTKQSNLAEAFTVWQLQNSSAVAEMKRLEEENNRLFIEAYGLQDELTPDVPDEQITITRADREKDSQRLISYAVGCMMGRYSLDEPGLIYAHAGNEGFDASRYSSFPADADGIVPITDTAWFEDDATNRIAEFLVAVWGKQTLDENLAWLAESLGGKTSDLPLEVIRKYLSNQFYKDHLQTYKKRPIYWHFSSGKHGAFQALVYLHRYNEGTLARMRSEYVVPLMGKLKSRIEMLEKDANSVTSTATRNKLNKEIEQLNKKQFELQTYDEKLRHYADMRIKLDLDDGVKVNYGKFGDLLSDVKAITGGSDD